MDDWLKILPTVGEAKRLADKLRHLLPEGGFDLHQWASNHPEVISHLPPECTSESSKLWLTENGHDPQEHALGLMWHFLPDTLAYKLAKMMRVESSC